MPKLLSVVSTTFSLAMGCQKLGQPVPESNFVFELKRAVSQQMQRKSPLPCSSQPAPVYGRSVPDSRATSKEMGESCCFHASSGFTTVGTTVFPLDLPSWPNSTIVTVAGKVGFSGARGEGECRPAQSPESRCAQGTSRPQKEPPVLICGGMLMRSVVAIAFREIAHLLPLLFDGDGGRLVSRLRYRCFRCR